jgi:membrane fusion protein (multidrug efflux system)
MKTTSVISLVAYMILITSCGEKSSLDKLEEKRSELRKELSSVEEQIRAMDTIKEIFVPIVRTEKIDTGRFEHFVIVQGEVKTNQEAMVNAEANGVIRKLNVREGQFVKKGFVIAEIDAALLQSNLQELETQLEFAEYNYDKQKELYERGVGTEFELRQAKNQLNGLRSQLQTLKTQKSKTNVTAPFEGYIDEVFARQGDMAGAQAPLVRLVNNTDVRLSADVSEQYYTRIAEGTPIQAFFPSLRDTLSLTVTFLGKYIHPTNRTFKVQADVSNNEKLLPNMLAKVRIQDEVIENATIIPSTSLLKSQKNEDFIFILERDGEFYKAKQVFVQVMNRQDGKAVVEGLNGELKSGTLVVTDGARGIADNDIVRIF